VAATEGVRAGERHDFLVVEAHAIEDVAQVFLALGGVGRRPSGVQAVTSPSARPGAPWDHGSLHLLHSAYAG